ncbi:AtpZ/AtpI family protein [Koleobacter methoxysyntrophicus]|nr:AtpZ/AtpI family protein [Koleobacter methoxysyntrophicus]
MINLKGWNMKGLYGLSLVGFLGFSIALPLIGGIYLGRVLDERLGTQPLLLILGILLGIGTGFRSAYIVLSRGPKGK